MSVSRCATAPARRAALVRTGSMQASWQLSTQLTKPEQPYAHPGGWLRSAQAPPG
jgi:hypothetical protein